MAFRVITINANGLCDSNNRAGLLQCLRSFPSVVDVVCFQECHCSSENDSQTWFHSSGFSSVVSPGSVKSCCSIILYCPLLICGVILMVIFSWPRYLFAILFLESVPFSPLTGILLETSSLTT